MSSAKSGRYRAFLAYAEVVKSLKKELRRLKEQLEDTDEQYPELLRGQEEYW
ncbi:MAG: hypothetical protein ACYTFK_03690 [Planctomycetota bacterium]|jgi:hypothetical protein